MLGIRMEKNPIFIHSYTSFLHNLLNLWAIIKRRELMHYYYAKKEGKRRKKRTEIAQLRPFPLRLKGIMYAHTQSVTHLHIIPDFLLLFLLLF